MRIKSNSKIADRGFRGESSGRKLVDRCLEGSGILLMLAMYCIH